METASQQVAKKHYSIVHARPCHTLFMQKLEETLWKNQEGGQAYGQHGNGSYDKLLHAGVVLVADYDKPDHENDGMLRNVLGFVATERVNFNEMLRKGLPSYDHDPFEYHISDGDTLYMVNLCVDSAETNRLGVKGLSRELGQKLIEEGRHVGAKHIRTVWHEKHPYLTAKEAVQRFWGGFGFVHEPEFDTDNWAPVTGLPGRHTEIWGLKL